MANKTFNIAKGRIAEKLSVTPNKLHILLLQAVEADDDLLDHANVQDLLAAPGNIECDFTNYARVTDEASTVTVDNVNNKTVADCADQTFVDAGGTLDNDILVAVFCQSEGAGDANLIPLSVNDWPRTTDGSTLVLEVPNGFHESIDAP